MVTPDYRVYQDLGYSVGTIDSLCTFLSNHPEIYWIKLGSDGLFELVLDNQMLSTYRGCASHFFEAYVRGVVTRSGGRSWQLDFGALFHERVEEYYMLFRQPDFNVYKWAIQDTTKAWQAKDMEAHAMHKEFKSLGGITGLSSILVLYATKYSQENERLRVIATEISFGKNKEVPMGRSGGVRLFLSGRIDVLVDDGVFIAPMDHKTKGSFRNDPTRSYEVDEGPTGYIFAMNSILSRLVPKDQIIRRKCNKITMNYISKAATDNPLDRFRREPIYKTQEQLEDYRLRMVYTAEDIFRDLIRFVQTGIVERDTSKCTNWYMHDCPYLAIHRQNSKRDEDAIRNSLYKIAPIWDTELVGKGAKEDVG